MIALPETNSSHLKKDGWNTFLLGSPIFGYVSLRGCRFWWKGNPLDTLGRLGFVENYNKKHVGEET